MGKLAIAEPTLTDREQVWVERVQEALFHLPTPESNATEATWRRLRENASGILKVPSLNQREAGGTLLTWRNGIHHFDVEIEATGALDFFYMNLETNDAWDIEAALTDNALPEPVLDALKYFCLTIE